MNGQGQTVATALARYFRAGDPGECWPWQGPIATNGYGIVRIGGRQKKAHRVVFEALKGPIPDGHVVRHTCDNPPCVNPEHLLTGTAADNNRDTRERRRNLFGSRNQWARLHEYDVAELRRRRAAGEQIAALAREFGVHETTAGHAIHGRTWKHLSDDVVASMCHHPAGKANPTDKEAS